MTAIYCPGYCKHGFEHYGECSAASPLPVVRDAPTNLAEALDCLQAFLPADRSLHILASKPNSVSVFVRTGDYKNEIQGAGYGKARASDALFEAERAHAKAWNAKHGSIAAAEAEFGSYCPRLAA